jgi:eukaryotic-like serine/threonine-protein kinase
MTHCPSDEKLEALLNESLTTAERGAIAEHVERCAMCIDKLARVSTDSGVWRPAGSPQPSAEEDETMNRLKEALRFSDRIPPNHHDALTLDAAPGRPASTATIDFEIPSVPGYEIIEILGRGGMGVVFKARQLALDRIVALKMFQNWATAGEKELARFRAEADVIARLQHPNIVEIHDVGEITGRPYFVLEYIAGGSLAEHLDGTPQPPRLASQFVEVLARAVQVAHANDVVHRDLKPANILLIAGESTSSTVGRAAGVTALKSIPKIADFGLAKIAHGDREARHRRSLTVTGDLIGTPSYMAPEQAAPSGALVGPSADVYALGAILYELLTGRPPFMGETPLDTVLQVLHTEPVPVTRLQPNIPRDLETICMKCLRKEPLQRYQSARELADDLQNFMRGKPIQARPRGTAEKVWRWIREHPLPSGLLAAGLAAPIVALAVLSLLSAGLVRSSALESAAQQAELLEQANNQYSLIVQRVEKAHYPVNKMVPPTPGTVPLSIPATFLHDVGEELSRDSKTGIQVRQFSDYPFPWRTNGGPHDDFERDALAHLRQSHGRDTVHVYENIDGEPVVRYAQARIMQQSCVNCHNTHPKSSRKDWKVGDVRGVLEIIRPLKNDQTRITQALQVTLLLSAFGSGLLILGSVLAFWAKRRAAERGS